MIRVAGVEAGWAPESKPLIVVDNDGTEYDVVGLFNRLTKIVEALDEAIRDCPHCSEKYERIRGMQELTEVDL